jgi:uncharacterized protein
MAQTVTIDQLLNLAADSPERALSQLRQHPELASKQDARGYSLLHAATSYHHLDLVKALVQGFNVNINLKDEDDETCLFNAESVDFAKELVELGVDIHAKNQFNETAAEKLDDEDEFPEVAAYLKGLNREGETSDTTAQAGSSADTGPEDVHPPPPLPNGVQVNMGTMHENEAGEAPDPDFRRRIEELASRQDFEGEEGQRELRELVSVRPLHDIQHTTNYV